MEIDNELIQEALKFGEHRTKRAVVEAALQEYVQRNHSLPPKKAIAKTTYSK